MTQPESFVRRAAQTPISNRIKAQRRVARLRRASLRQLAVRPASIALLPVLRDNKRVRRKHQPSPYATQQASRVWRTFRLRLPRWIDIDQIEQIASPRLSPIQQPPTPPFSAPWATFQQRPCPRSSTVMPAQSATPSDSRESPSRRLRPLANHTCSAPRLTPRSPPRRCPRRGRAKRHPRPSAPEC